MPIGHDVVDGEVNISGEEPPPEAPDAPTGVTATEGDSEVIVSWNSSFGASEYHVYREQQSGGGTDGGGTDGGGNFYLECPDGSAEYGDCIGTCFNDGDCTGGCLAWLGDGYCDDGTWGLVFQCDEYGNDCGDCGTGGDPYGVCDGDGGGDDGGEGVIGDEPNSLWLIDNGDNNWDIGFNSDNPIGGFQLNVDGASIVSASGGAATDAGFMISTNSSTALGFSLSPLYRINSTVIESEYNYYID